MYISTSVLITAMKKYNIHNISKMDCILLLLLLYVDNRAIPFGSRSDAVLGTKIIINIFTKQGLIPYTGTKEKESKTKAVFFPGTHDQEIEISKECDINY